MEDIPITEPVRVRPVSPFQRVIDAGYAGVKHTRLSESDLVVAGARRVRDALFYASLARHGLLGEEVTRTSVLDHELYVDLRDRGISRTLYLNGRYDTRLTDALPDLVDPGDAVVDVGANIGYFTVLLSALVGETGRVHALEPDPRNAALLERNVELNECTNVTVEQAAVADEPGTVHLHTHETEFSRSSITETDGRRRDLDVPVVTVPGVVAGSVDFLKIDVVGAEIAVLDGALSIIERDRPAVVLPVLPDKWPDAYPETFVRLASLDYRVETLDGTPGGPLGDPGTIADLSGQNVVLTASPEARSRNRAADRSGGSQAG